METLIEELPLEMRESIKALADDKRLEIVLQLLKHEELTFSQLMKATGLKSSIISHHLKKLVQSSLIENIYKKIEGSEEYSFYNITTFGESMMANLLGNEDVIRKIQEAIVRSYLYLKSESPFKLKPISHNYNLINESEYVTIEREVMKEKITFYRNNPVNMLSKNEKEVIEWK